MTPLLDLFKGGMVIDYEKWHDGVGYDLSVIEQMSPAERSMLNAKLRDKLKSHPDWRDVEALHTLNGTTPPPPTDAEIVHAIESAVEINGLVRAIDLAANHNTDPVRQAVLNRARTGDPTTRVNMAALLYFLCGLSNEVFDWSHRPFFLLFGEAEFQPAWNQLRDKLNRLVK